MTNGKFRLLEAFRTSFAGTVYRHRDPTIGNKIARELFEDLYYHKVSVRFSGEIDERIGAVNRGGTVHGRLIRRNDSFFGLVPAGVEVSPLAAGVSVPEGLVAEPRVGAEVKILAKAQLKQIDRVVSDLHNFVGRMKKINGRCINIAVVGINHEQEYIGYEGRRRFRGRLGAQEPTKVATKLEELRDEYDELLVLSFRASNQSPYPFSWVSDVRVNLDYGAALRRVGVLYQERFRA